MRDGDRSAEEAFLISTSRLVMRPRAAGDDLVIHALADNPAIAPNLCATIPVDGGEDLVIVARHNGDIVGVASHGPTGLGSGMEAALWIGEPYWGRGYATEAAHALIDRVFGNGLTTMLWCSNRVTNPRARRVIEKCGFQFRGNGMVRLPGRGAFPIERFALDRRNWQSLKMWGAGALPLGEPGRLAGDAPRETAA
jgi:RimJ/RimL family protein N-acetyltransferase